MYLNLIKVTLLRGCSQCIGTELCRIPLNFRLEVKMGLRRAKMKWEKEFR